MDDSLNPDELNRDEQRRKRGRKEKAWSSVEWISDSSQPLRRQALEWLKSKQILHKQVCHECMVCSFFVEQQVISFLLTVVGSHLYCFKTVGMIADGD